MNEKLILEAYRSNNEHLMSVNADLLAALEESVMYRWNHHPWCAYMQGGDDEECTCGRDDIVAKAGAAIAKAKRVQV